MLADGNGRRAGRLRASRPGAHPPGQSAGCRGARRRAPILLSIDWHTVRASLPGCRSPPSPVARRCAGNRGWPASGGREHLIEHLMFSSGRP